MESLTVLGATGSIGTQTLDVVRRHPDRFRIHALTACSRWHDMASLCSEFSPETVVMTDPDAAAAPGRDGPAADAEHGVVTDRETEVTRP